jgi:Relaxase/Mobilisation nuclease domain
MIGKITIGKSFKGCLLYCLNDKLPDQNLGDVMKDRAEVLLFNQCYGNPKELIQQFNEVRQLNTKLSKPVLHITLSLAPGEQLSKDKLMELCRNCATDMGFENN